MSIFPPLRKLEAASATLAFLVLSGCGTHKRKPVSPVVTVQAQAARLKPLQEVVSADAVLYPLQEAELTPPVSAPVKRFYVNLGSRVHKGQLLAVLQDAELSGNYQQAQGEYEQAQANYRSITSGTLPEQLNQAQLTVNSAQQSLRNQQRIYQDRRHLFAQGAISRNQLDDSEVALVNARNALLLAQQRLRKLRAVQRGTIRQSAQGQLTAAAGRKNAARALLDYSQVRSPINGVVTARSLYPGQIASAGTPLVTVMNTSRMVARAHIPEQQAALVKLGQTAAISVDGTTVPARVTLVNSALDPNSTTVEVWAETQHADLRLRPGAAATLTIDVRNVPQALVVPASALLTAGNGQTSIMVAGPDGRAHLRPVTVGVRTAGEAELLSGVHPGEMVITQGSFGLDDGTRVKVASAK